MSARTKRSALLHAPIRTKSAWSLASLPPRTKPLVRKFARNCNQSDTFGPPELCTWPVGPGTCRFQTRRPDLARKLSQRSGARLVAWSVAGGYLRVFEERIEPWRARELVGRFLTATNGAFSHLKRPPAPRKSREVSRQREVAP
jgi:hypothetical protein